MTLGLPTQGQPANIGLNTEQISRQREPEADPSFGDSLGQWVRVKAQCPMVRSWSGQVLVRPQLTPKGRGNGIPITGRHPLCYHSLQEHRMSTGLCLSSDPSLGASATKRKKKKGPIFKEHHCWAYLLLKRAVLEKAKYSLVGRGADFPFLQHSKLSLSLLTEEKLCSSFSRKENRETGALHAGRTARGAGGVGRTMSCIVNARIDEVSATPGTRKYIYLCKRQ